MPRIDGRGVEAVAVEVFAKAKMLRLSPQKARVVADQVRGKDVGKALDILRTVGAVFTRVNGAVTAQWQAYARDTLLARWTGDVLGTVGAILAGIGDAVAAQWRAHAFDAFESGCAPDVLGTVGAVLTWIDGTVAA